MSTPLNTNILLVTMALSACTLNPDYTRPVAPIPQDFSVSQDMREITIQPNSWQQYFTEPELQQLITNALANNRDYRITALRIEEARAQYGIQRSERLPSVDGTLGYDRGRTFAQGQRINTDIYRVGVGISDFELDFFGRVKSLSTAALEEYLATEEAKQTARTSLISEVAIAYLNLRSLNERLVIAQNTLASRDVGFTRIKRRFDAGIDTAIDMKSAELQLETSKASIAALKREQLQAVNALNLIVGDQTTTLFANEPLNTLRFAALPVGLPSDLIERRPDIRAAEHRLKAANANIGAARAAFFPRVQLTTNIGVVNESFSKLFSSGARVWTFTPQLTLPIFNYGRNQANLDLASVRKNITIAEYEKTIQTAFSEVSDVLVARSQIEEQIEAQFKVTEAERERLRLATRRYDRGISNYLELLDAQRSLFDSEQLLVQLKQISLSNSINLFKVLGGEWET